MKKIMLHVYYGGKVNKYYLQEKVNEYWFDLYSADLCMLKGMIVALKRRNPEKKYRIVGVYI